MERLLTCVRPFHEKLHNFPQNYFSQHTVARTYPPPPTPPPVSVHIPAVPRHPPRHWPSPAPAPSPAPPPCPTGYARRRANSSCGPLSTKEPVARKVGSVGCLQREGRTLTQTSSNFGDLRSLGSEINLTWPNGDAPVTEEEQQNEDPHPNFMVPKLLATMPDAPTGHSQVFRRQGLRLTPPHCMRCSGLQCVACVFMA